MSPIDTKQMRKNDGNEKLKYKTKHTGTEALNKKCFVRLEAFNTDKIAVLKHLSEVVTEIK